MQIYVASRHDRELLSLLSLDKVAMSLSSKRNLPVAACLNLVAEQSAAFSIPMQTLQTCNPYSRSVKKNHLYIRNNIQLIERVTGSTGRLAVPLHVPRVQGWALRLKL